MRRPRTVHNAMHHKENHYFYALVDLGASINVMPHSIYKMLHLGELKPTRVIIRLANKATMQPLRIIEDVLVHVKKLIFPTDFYAIEM